MWRASHGASLQSRHGTGGTAFVYLRDVDRHAVTNERPASMKCTRLAAVYQQGGQLRQTLRSEAVQRLIGVSAHLTAWTPYLYSIISLLGRAESYIGRRQRPAPSLDFWLPPCSRLAAATHQKQKTKECHAIRATVLPCSSRNAQIFSLPSAEPMIICGIDGSSWSTSRN